METSLIICNENLDVLIKGWLDAKFRKSTSLRTAKEYAKTLKNFSEYLQRENLDLGMQDEKSLTKISLLAQDFAGDSKRGIIISPATYNQRLAILSSFYEYCIVKKAFKINPINGIERGKVQPYAGAKPLQETQAGLDAINRQTLQGKRDYALLAILLSTGRRASEVAGLTLADIERQKSGKVTLIFRHCKGGKVMRDTLALPIANALTEWLVAFYGSDWQSNNLPIWVMLKNAGSGKGNNKRTHKIGDALTIQSIADICQKHLGTSIVHATRHTWAYQMEEAGAKVSLIQAKLGHESLATTGRYLAALKSDENEYAETIVANMGIK